MLAVQDVRIDTALVGRKLKPLEWVWGPPQTILYALGVGAAPPRDLPLLFEGAGPVVLPTFGTVTTGLWFLGMLDELGLGLGSVLHGEQSIALHRAIPPSGSATVTRRVADVWDKGAGAIVVIEEQADDHGPLFTSRSSWFVAGAGGFGGDRGPSASAISGPPTRAPDACTQRTIRPEQSALYRLSGDLNPIHVDPVSARAAGFDGVFIHGLCTFGMVGLELVMELCGGLPQRLIEMDARFVAPVKPGDELTIDLWLGEDDAVQMQASVDDRVVLFGGRARLGDAD